MGSKDNSGNGFFKTRPHLADITNRPAKRPFSLVSDDGEDSQLAKQMRLGVESLAKSKNQQLQFGAQTHLNNDDRVMLQPKDKCPVLLPFGDDASRLFEKPGLLHSDGREEQNVVDLGSIEFRERGEGIVPTDRAVESCDNDVCGVDNLGSPKGGAVQMPTISASHDSNFMGLKPCSRHTGDGGASSVIDEVDIKSCTCSFCCKAAYIWSDIHYQDAKGRLSAMKKSQKEAKAIIQKISGLENTVMHGQHQSQESLELELSLVHQWKALFVQMQNIYTQESSQLEPGFEALKDLREKCKNDLELNGNRHRENQ